MICEICSKQIEIVDGELWTMTITAPWMTPHVICGYECLLKYASESAERVKSIRSMNIEPLEEIA